MGKICSTPKSAVSSISVNSSIRGTPDGGQGNSYHFMTDGNVSILTDQKSAHDIEVQALTENEMELYQIHKLIGLLICKKPCSSESVQGTGVLISSNLVLTSAHNVYFSKRNDLPLPEIEFYPGVHGEVGKGLKGYQIVYPEQYSPNCSERNKYDFALIKLAEEIQIKNQPFLGINFRKIPSIISIFGYPSKNNLKYNLNKRIQKAYQKGLTGEGPKTIEQNYMTYEISTELGMSGCPIVAGKFRNVIVGIHKAGARAEEEEWNVGLRINQKMILRLQIMRETIQGKPFKVFSYDKGELNMTTDKTFLAAKQVIKEHQSTNFQLQNRLTEQQQKINQLSIINQSSMMRRMQALEAENRRLKQQSRQPEVDNNVISLQNLAEQQYLANQTPGNGQGQPIYLNASNHQNSELVREPYVFVWDDKSKDANRFRIQQGTMIHLVRLGKTIPEMKSLDPLPPRSVTTFKFKIHCMGGQYQINIGIQAKNEDNISFHNFRKLRNFSGRKIISQTVLPIKDVKDFRKGKEYEEGLIQMKVDLRKFLVTFLDLSQKVEKTHELETEFRTGQTYVICQMMNLNDCVQVLTWE